MDETGHFAKDKKTHNKKWCYMGVLLHVYIL